jgi:hypothetical protein
MDDTTQLLQSFEQHEIATLKQTLESIFTTGKMPGGQEEAEVEQPQPEQSMSFAAFLRQQAMITTSPDAHVLSQSASLDPFAAVQKLNSWKDGWGDDLYIAYDCANKRKIADLLTPNSQLFDAATGKKYQITTYTPGAPVQAIDLATNQPVAIDESKAQLFQPMVAYLTVTDMTKVSEKVAKLMQRYKIHEVSSGILNGDVQLVLGPQGINELVNANNAD